MVEPNWLVFFLINDFCHLGLGVKIALENALVQLNTPFSYILHSTFEFPSRVNLPVPVCTVSPGHLVNKADTQ